MDPLVRAALGLQQLIARGVGTAIAAAFAGCLVAFAAGAWAPEWNFPVVVAFAGSVAYRARRRLGRLTAPDVTRLDLELFTHLVVLAYLLVLVAPGGLDGPYYPGIYALMMLTAAFARLPAAVGTAVFGLLLECALQAVSSRSLRSLVPHAGLVVAFAALNLLVFRAEISRVRRLSRARLDGEIQRMKDDARSYRLNGAPSTAPPPSPKSSPTASVPKPDPERLLRSSVEQIHTSVELALKLARRSLELESAALLWVEAGGQSLTVREIATDDADVDRGPFRAEGLCGAALARREPVSLTSERARKHVPFYRGPKAIESVCVLPVNEHGHCRGLLVVDRKAAVPFSNKDLALLGGVAEFVVRTIENERVFVQLERAKIEQGKLYRAVDLLAAATTEAEVIEAGVESAREFAAFDFAVVTLFHRQGQGGTHEICAASGEGAEELVGQSYRHNGGLVAMVVANKHPLPYRGDYDPAHQVVFTRRLKPPEMPSLVVLPLLVHENVLGTLVLGSNQRGAFGDSVRPILEVLSRHIAVSLANARMVKRLEDLATTDGLTGLYNKRTLIELGKQKLRSAERFEKPLSVLVCDIDHFKKVNDTHGHDVGDVVIKGFGDVLRRTKRDTDAVGRFGGEEFVLVCEETDGKGAELLAERIRAELEATTFHANGATLNVTCSIGVATFPRAGTTWDGLFKSTDEALYASKRGGRNRVTAWNPKLRGAAA